MDTHMHTGLTPQTSPPVTWAPRGRAAEHTGIVRRLSGPMASVSARGGLSIRALGRAFDCMERHLGGPLSLDDLARAACVSRFHFARLFRVSTGHSPMAYLQLLRVERAKELLREGRVPIADIALLLGFCDQSHFSRAFRRVTGLTARGYLRDLLRTTEA